MCRAKLREKFEENRHLTDIRVIDMLIVKVSIKHHSIILSTYIVMNMFPFLLQGQQELQECVMTWKQPCHILAYWRDSVDPKPKDFLSKFLDGHN